MSEEVGFSTIKTLLGNDVIIEIDSFLKNKLKNEGDHEKALSFLINEIGSMVLISEQRYGTVQGMIVFFMFNNSDNSPYDTGISYVMVDEDDEERIDEILSQTEESTSLICVRLEEIKKILTLH